MQLIQFDIYFSHYLYIFMLNYITYISGRYSGCTNLLPM